MCHRFCISTSLPFSIAVLLGSVGPVSGQSRVIDHDTLQEGDECTNARYENRSETLRCWRVLVFGDGNVSGVVSDEGQTAPAAGALGLVVEKRTYDFQVLVNIASTADSVSESFSESLLPRASGGALKAGLLEFRIRDPLKSIRLFKEPSRLGPVGEIDWYFYVSGSTRDWRMTDLTPRFDESGIQVGTDSSTAVFSVPSVALGLGVYREFIKHRVADTDLEVAVDLGLTHRALAGDLRGEEFDDLRARQLGGTGVNFWGWEVGLGLGVNNLMAEFYYYNFFSPDDIRGLSHGNIVARFSIRGNLVDAKRMVRIKEEPETDTESRVHGRLQSW